MNLYHATGGIMISYLLATSVATSTRMEPARKRIKDLLRCLWCDIVSLRALWFEFDEGSVPEWEESEESQKSHQAWRVFAR